MRQSGERDLAEDPHNADPGARPAGPDPAILAATLGGLGSPADPRVAAFLDAHSDLARLQAAHLHERHALEIRHLRWQLFDDRMQGGLKIAVVAVIIVIAGFLGRAVWSALDDNSLVIELFNVPEDFAQHGLSGEVVATQFLDKLTQLQDRTDAIRAPSNYTNDWGNDLKVQIPDTGVSLGEVNQYLRRWLGHETRIEGAVWRTKDGIAVDARAGNVATETYTGAEGDLDGLLQKAAEAIYAKTQPYRYSVFLMQTNRDAAAIQVVSDLARSDPPRDRAWDLIGWGNILWKAGQLTAARAKYTEAARISPTNANAPGDLATLDLIAGHDQAMLSERNEAVRRFRGAAHGDVDDAFVQGLRGRNAGLALALTGDYRGALVEYQAALDDRDTHSAYIPVLEAASEARDHEPLRARLTLSGAASHAQINFDNQIAVLATAARIDADLDLADWHGLRADLDGAKNLGAGVRGIEAYYTDVFLPWVAWLTAHDGDFKTADSLIGGTPLDCDPCVRMRGRIAALHGDRTGAAHWFAMVSARSPAIPFADTDWGLALLQEGAFDGAIARFAVAHAKGPRFADPLEMWGEALIAKNRSDLALVKFEEAARYAPNWGRLHLKWGEALLWGGDREGARKQFAMAAALFLTPSEQTELTRVRTFHG